tara:strand:+ start:839 stop:1471 length:633 start_codon:yes stop_codon:yes gene_type:complete
MKNIFLLTILFTTVHLKSQPIQINYEWFSLSGGFLYSVEDEYTGLNGKINLPLGSHAKFVMQASLFPEQFQNPEEAYNEARAKFNVEFIPYKFKKLYLSVQTGFDYGYWQRTFLIPNSTLGLNWKKEESMMFGAIINYDFNRYRLYLDYMYMPEIYSNHIGIGISMLFFENNSFRKKYMQRKYMKSKKGNRSRKKRKRNPRKNSSKLGQL